MPTATITINSWNYGAWSLRGWLICKFAGLELEEIPLDRSDPEARAELLLISPSVRVPRLTIGGVEVWDTLAIGEYLNELFPAAELWPTDQIERAHCRSLCGELHAGFADLRTALPMNIKVRHENFKVFAGAQAEIDYIVEIWHGCLEQFGGPYLFGANRTIADAMMAPICTRFVTYNVELDATCRRYLDTILAMPEMAEWTAKAEAEPEVIDELDIEF